MSLPFPSEGLVYDYRLDDGGISRMGKSDDEEEDVKKSFKVQLCNTCMVCNTFTVMWGILCVMTIPQFYALEKSS